CLTAVPIRLVVQRLFANHETQSLDVWYQGKDIGQCRITVTPRAKLDAKESEPVTGRPGAYFVDANLGMHLDILGTPTPLQLDTWSWFDSQRLPKKYTVRTTVGTSRVKISGDNDTKKLDVELEIGERP